MNEAAPDTADSRSGFLTRRFVGVVVSALAVLVGGGLLLVVLCFRAIDPPDCVNIRVKGMPKETSYWFLVSEQAGNTMPVNWYEPMDGPGRQVRAPSNGGERMPILVRQKEGWCWIQWKKWDRLAFVCRDANGEWTWTWLPKVPKRLGERSLWGGGEIEIDLAGLSGDRVPREQVMKLLKP